MSVLHRLKRSGDIENLRSVELTELFRARDASCPKGNKMEIEVNLTNRNLWRDFLNFPYFTGFSAH